MDYKVLYSKLVDSCVIHYTSWAYLQLHRMVNLQHYSHLKLITKSLVSGQEVIWKVMWSIVNHLSKANYDQLEREFQKATGHHLQDYFEFERDELRQFLQKKPGMFKVNEQTGEVRAIPYDEKQEFKI